jgi:hypothetical protein
VLEFTGLPSKMVRKALFALAIWCVVAAPARAQDAPGLRIVPLVKDGQVFVSMQLADGFTEEVRAAIRSGLKTTFTYVVDLRLDVPVWVDRTLGSATIASSVLFDNLERRFTLERFVDGRPTERFQTEDEVVVRQWTTDLVKLPLFRTRQLETNRDYYVRVSATARPSNGLLLWPFSGGTSGQAKFTFIR